MQLKKLLSFLVLIVFLAACSSGEKGKGEAISKPSKVKVETYAVKPSKVENARSFTGQVVSKNTVFMTPKVVGYISAINVKIGDKFKKGDTLVELTSKELLDKRSFATASVNEAENGLKQAEIGLEMAKSAYNQALAQFELAEKTYNRFQKLFETESVSKQEFDEVQAKYKLALEGKNMAQKNVELAEEKLNQVKLKKMQAEAALSEVNTYISYTKLKAPFDGVVLEKMSDVGNLASYSTPVLKLGTLDSEIIINIPENFYNNISVGKKVSLKIPSQNKTIESEIIEVSKDINPASRTFYVKLTANGKDLIPGMFVEGYFGSSLENSIVIPKDYVFQRGQLSYVFVDNSQKAEMRMVKTGNDFGDLVEITSGLIGGEKIVKPINDVQIKSGDILEAK
ncbi:efflux RND transporter periplasmic adaptor subunit [Deferribacteraceae bacterium V6Fe1]|nr:efflux RND transporter periplasmic adaptor subunit [Deferribacteraceae bacterium V6Fe1]